ncbi:MAG: porin [Candidatus Gastranaerophilales bacterium]|nr:porin [Candidatus Gastranaerophilales bacterium]
MNIKFTPVLLALLLTTFNANVAFAVKSPLSFIKKEQNLIDRNTSAEKEIKKEENTTIIQEETDIFEDEVEDANDIGKEKEELPKQDLRNLEINKKTKQVETNASTSSQGYIDKTLKQAKPVVKESSQDISSKKLDLRAVLFNPNAEFDAPAKAEGREMTSKEEAMYKLHAALHDDLEPVSTKFLSGDRFKMTFDKGPIESITPWVDYSGTMQCLWNGENYANSLFRTRFQDVGINGRFRNKKTVFRVMFNTGLPIDGNSYLQSMLFDNYIMHYFTPNDQFLLGYARTAVGIEGGESPYTIPFIGRSQLSSRYGNSRALGAKVQGNHKFYDYSAGFFSSGRYFHSWFDGPEFVGLFSVKPLAFTDGKWGKLTVGGSMDAGNSNSNDKRYTVAGVHLIHEYKRLKATIEYAAADGSNGSTGFSKNQSEGFYGTLAYRVTPKIEALVRYDQFDPNKNAANDIRREYTAGLNYYIKGQALKLMLNGIFYSLENGTYGTKLLVGTQIIL